MSVCKRCGGSIEWQKRENGKWDCFNSGTDRYHYCNPEGITEVNEAKPKKNHYKILERPDAVDIQELKNATISPERLTELLPWCKQAVSGDCQYNYPARYIYEAVVEAAHGRDSFPLIEKFVAWERPWPKKRPEPKGPGL